MSKRLIIIVEGQTEQQFVKESLAPYLYQVHGIYNVTPILIRTSEKGKGGLVKYDHLKNDAKKYLQESDVLVTTFVDFFRLPTDTPGLLTANAYKNVNDKITYIQNEILNDFIKHFPKQNLPQIFVPYIQKYEFEALLFTANDGFEAYPDSKIHERTKEIIEQYPNPEEINSGAETAPSKRILKIIPNYNKVVDGNLIIEKIIETRGIDFVLEKCPRFKQWLMNLIPLLKE